MAAKSLDSVNGTKPAGSGGNPDFEAAIIGAGFSGLRMLYELRRIGVSAKIFETGSEVGGTWYWNNYPGCRTDCESWVYALNCSKELCQEWTWSERYPRQPEVKQYLNFVADRFDMRKDILFNSQIKSAHFDEDKNVWKLETSKGEKYSSVFLILGTGLLSSAKKIPFPGYESFKGDWYQTSSWPKDKEVSFKDKRVAVVGTGATGVQIVPVAAHVAKSVHVFQRTPNYILPARNYTVTKEHATEIKQNYDDIWACARGQVFGLDIPPTGRLYADVKDDPETVQKAFDAGWEAGGFNFVFETFDDLFTSEECNKAACDFLRNKTRAIVKDPKTAEKLNPDYALFSKRPPLGHRYLESFNRPNVHLVDIKESPIQEITPKGIRTSTDEYEFDIIVYAIGFDAVTGPITSMDIRGRNGRAIANEWSTKIDTMLGIGIEGFPNLFMMSGPKGTFSNFPMIIDTTGTEIGKMINYLRETGQQTIEPTKAAQDNWNELCEQLYGATVMSKTAEKVGSWFTGANIPGKPTGTLYYFGGLQNYIAECQKESSAGFPGFVCAR
ncbi:hypothetical protein AYO21_03242 [Fonsecaea monophora]|uniref:Cyclohexanone monooxygenase n=1 Tax=Fonsecaea monophora TaxID=254056 RepID=A0A177FES1_9EURO|nr:hypothetical protein AYO21_03242 [Fonsecaea monophora]OAG42657.1 hypothetical protein AYO21_03242 [Fonsecaea monophora]